MAEDCSLYAQTTVSNLNYRLLTLTLRAKLGKLMRMSPPLSLRGGAKPRRGNPAEPSGNPRIAPASRITTQTGLPRPDGLAMTA